MNHYYNRFNASKNYEKSLFLAGRGLQSAELNEIQESALYKLKSLGDALFKDGDVVRGCTCIVQDHTVTLEEGALYLKGAVRNVPAATLTISSDQRFHIGVFLKETTVTELEDPTLRDPAVGTRNYQEPGASRLQLTLSWGDTATDSSKGDFYPVYVIDHGVLILNAPAPELDSVTVALARYDRESNGSYIVRGFDVKYLETTENQQIFILNEGKAHVDGYEIELPHSVRLQYALNPDLSKVESEPHTFQPDQQGHMQIFLNNPTCESIQAVDITQQKTINLTHGSFSGSTDPIPDQAILEIVHIRQGSTVYTQGSDFRLKAGSSNFTIRFANKLSKLSKIEGIYRKILRDKRRHQTSKKLCYIKTILIIMISSRHKCQFFCQQNRKAVFHCRQIIFSQVLPEVTQSPDSIMNWSLKLSKREEIPSVTTEDYNKAI